MKIGIIGTGSVGSALGKALARKGFHVMFGARELAKANALAGEIEHYAVGGTIANAIHYGEVVILAVPYKAVESVLRNTDKLALRGKILIDCTNPLIFGEKTELAFGYTTSAAEQIALMAPDAQVVKTFNTAFAEHMENGPYFGPNDASMFYCGGDENAKAAVASIIEATGFEPVDAGPLDSARLLEPMGALLVRMALDQKQGKELGFKLLRR